MNRDPFEPHRARVQAPLAEPGIGADLRSQVHELISDEQHSRKGPVQTIQLDPRAKPAAIFPISRFPHKNYGTLRY